MKNLTERYLQTYKGRNIIAALMLNPIKLCQPIYKNGMVYHKINGKLLNPKEVEIWKSEQQKESLKYFGLTEDDTHLSEEKLEKIIFEEGVGKIRNIELIDINDAGSEDLKDSIIELTRSRMREMGLG